MTDKRTKLVPGLVILSRATGCRHCDDTKRILASHGIEALHIEASDIKELFNTRHSTVPQIYYKGKYIGDASKIRLMSMMDEITTTFRGGYYDENGEV